MLAIKVNLQRCEQKLRCGLPKSTPAHTQQVSKIVISKQTDGDAPARETLAEIFERGRLHNELVDLRLYGEHFVGIKVASCGIISARENLVTEI
jgi:hypothetical protein